MNTCDLEEAKNVALIKLMELSLHPEKWQRDRGYYYGIRYTCGNFSIYHPHTDMHIKTRIVARISEEILGVYSAFTDSRSPTGDVRIKDCFRNIDKWHEEKECEELRRKIIRDAQESCLKINEALGLVERKELKKAKWWQFWKGV